MNAALFVSVAVLWSAGWTAVAFQVAVAPAPPSVAWRLLLAGLLLQGFLRVTGRHPGTPWRDLPYVALQGLAMSALNNLLFYEAVAFIPSGLLAVAMAVVIPMNAVGLRLLYGVPFSRGVLMGAPVAAAGLALVFLPQWDGLLVGGAWKGLVLGVAGSVVVTAGNMAAVRNARAGLKTLPIIADGLCFAAPVAIAVSLGRGMGMPFPLDAYWVGALAFQVVMLSIVSFFLYYTVQDRIGADRAAFILLVVPVLTLALSSVFEGYVWTWTAGAGLALVMAGNALALGGRRRT